MSSVLGTPSLGEPRAPRRLPTLPRPAWRPVWSAPAARRAVRATLVMPPLFAVCYEAIGSLQMARRAGHQAHRPGGSVAARRRDDATAAHRPRRGRAAERAAAELAAAPAAFTPAAGEPIVSQHALWLREHLDRLSDHPSDLIAPAARLAQVRRRPWRR